MQGIRIVLFISFFSILDGIMDKIKVEGWRCNLRAATSQNFYLRVMYPFEADDITR